MTRQQKSLGPDAPPRPPGVPGLPFNAQELEELRKTAFRLHLQNVHLGQVADEHPPIAKTQMGATCPICTRMIGCFVGYNLTMTARFEDEGCDIKFTCSGTRAEPHEPAEISFRMFHTAQQDAIKVMTTP